MKISIYLFSLLFILTGCYGPKYYLGKGNYDMATRTSVAKLRKKPSSKKNILILEKAYPLANEQNNEKIKFLRKEGRPDVWDEIFSNYSALKDRQNLVKTVIPLKIDGRTVTFPYVDYDAEAIAAKKNASEYFYAHAQKLLETKNRGDARQAYDELKQLKSYYPDYKDVDALLAKAREMGLSWALVSVDNQSPYKLSPDYLKELMNINLTQFNSEWVHFTDQKIYTNTDYQVSIKLKSIDASPEQVKEEQTIETKEIQDGWDYYLDSNGNVMKDSLGNDIKKPKYKTITCKLNKTYQRKSFLVSGAIEFIDNSSNQVLKSVPCLAESKFENMWATATGDLEALKPESKKILNSKALPFPSDAEMLGQASSILKGVITKAFNENKYVLK